MRDEFVKPPNKLPVIRNWKALLKLQKKENVETKCGFQDNVNRYCVTTHYKGSFF